MTQRVSPTFRQLVMRWLMAEPEIWKNARYATDADRLALVLPRVLAVIKGEVKWSEAGAGDRAIWKGRARDVDGVGVERYLNQYDTVWIAPNRCDDYDSLWPPNDRRGVGALIAPGSTKIFNSRNVGYYQICSLQVPAMLAFDADVRIAQIYAVTDRSLDAADEVMVIANIGYHPVRIGPLREWVIGMPGGNECLVPLRQSFDMQIDARSVVAPLEITFHVEGVEIPR